jgi:hypothetical protein
MQKCLGFATLLRHCDYRKGGVHVHRKKCIDNQTSVNPMTDSCAWQTESLRFTFLGAPDAAAELISFSSLTGLEAESVTVKKSQNLRNEDGFWETYHLVISAQPGRIDVVFNPRTIQGNPQDGPSLPDLGDVRLAADKLLELIAKTRLPKSARLAVGSKLNLVTSSQAETIVQLSKYAPHLKIDADCIDVVYQQNKPKKIKQGGIELNRLTKWSQMMMQFMEMPAGDVPGFMPRTISKYILQIELDVNTGLASTLPHPDAYGPILQSLFSELKSMANLE